MARSEPSAVLIAGAGPTGLSLALFLAHQGIRPRIVERRSGPVEQSRALGVHARTLEFYRFLGIAEEAIELGIPARDVRLMRDGEETTRFSIADMGEGISPYPFMLTLAQDVHERFLIEKLAEAGVTVEWDTRLVAHEADARGVRATLRCGKRETVASARYLVRCDGGRSSVREGLGLAFEGGGNEGLFYVADVLTDRPSHDLFAAMAEDTVSLMFPVRRASGAQRLLGIVPPGLAGREDLDFEDVRHLPERTLGVEVRELHWISTYRVQHRVAERFRVGRVFIAGDAAHVHSPVGGQGMNTGIGDAMNLAWKLAAVLRDEAEATLLDSYEPERIAFARKLIDTTDQAFGPMVSTGSWSAFLRSVVAPNAIRLATKLPGLPGILFRTVSQTRITYRDGPLGEGRAGEVHGGDRLPWIEDAGSRSNFEPLGALDWQIHVYGSPGDALREAARALDLAVEVFDFTDEARRKGMARDAIYLVRPDGHVGLALPDQDEAALRDYVRRHGLRAGTAAPAPGG